MERLIYILLAIFFGSQIKAQTESTLPADIRTKDTLMKFAAKPGAGFNFEYLVYLPKGVQPGVTNYLMVETNNGGVNDTMSHHEKTAGYAAARSGVANYTSKFLKIPLLVPIFPRSATNWMIYTHALDRDAMLSKGTDIERLDLQLLAMIEDAKKQLAKQGYPLHDKFFMNGFSASGTFANRMSLLHPEKIKAIAAGGINSIAILPINELKGKKLEYPLGIADVKQITGKEVNLEAFRELPQLLYMGSLDDNDAAKYDDGYSKEESAVVFTVMGEQLIPQRWSFVEQVYKDNKVNAEFRTYPGIGHGTDLKMLNELVDFFRKHMN